jgi:AcrR family transcriptional regulator
VDEQDRRDLRADLANEARAAARDARARAREAHARAREHRELARERRIADHVSRDKQRHLTRPPLRVRGLTREEIVDAAVVVADAEGTEAVTMRRIARELGVGAMSLYWHVSSKDELQNLMLDAVQPAAPELSGDWRADLEAFARIARQGMLRHPWAIDYLVSGPPVGPNDTRNSDQLLAVLDGLGLDTRTAAWVAMTIATYVAGAVLREIQEIRWHEDYALTLAAMTAQEVEKLRLQWQEDHADPARYPHMARLMAEQIHPDSPETRDERFEFGLECLLDGIAARSGPPAAQ